MDNDSTQRLARLESNLAHLERLVEQLNEVVIAQGKELDRLKSGQQRLAQTIETAELDRLRIAQTKPPHYQ
jgi:uncharacterized coiled-coil protein SlyX